MMVKMLQKLAAKQVVAAKGVRTLGLSLNFLTAASAPKQTALQVWQALRKTLLTALHVRFWAPLIVASTSDLFDEKVVTLAKRKQFLLDWCAEAENKIHCAKIDSCVNGKEACMEVSLQLHKTFSLPLTVASRKAVAIVSPGQIQVAQMDLRATCFAKFPSLTIPCHAGPHACCSDATWPDRRWASTAKWCGSGRAKRGSCSAERSGNANRASRWHFKCVLQLCVCS